MASPFANYPQYIKEIREATRLSHPDKRMGRGKVIACGIISVIVAVILFVTVTTSIDEAQVMKALSSVTPDIEHAKIEVKVDGATENLSMFLSENDNGLSTSEEAKIADQIKTSLTADAMAKATGVRNGDGTLEARVVTEDGTPVVITMEQKEDGTYSIVSIVAQLKADTIDERKKEANSPLSTAAQKKKHRNDVADWSEDAFKKIAGTPEDLDKKNREALAEAASPLKVLSDNLVMVVPPRYAEQDIAQPSDEDRKPAKSDKDKTEEEKAADSINIYNRSYKSDGGSSILVRAENLGAAFSNMNGLEAVKKTMQYWQDTSKSVAEGAGQRIKDENIGYQTEVFYDEPSNMWGYWGRVELTDDVRDVVYNRVVFLDELADQMITVSYRHDCAAGEGGDRTLDDFKQLFMRAPGKAEEGADAFTKMLSDKYEARLERIQILPGDTVTVHEKKKAEATAKEKDEKAKTEEAKKE